MGGRGFLAPRGMGNLFQRSQGFQGRSQRPWYPSFRKDAKARAALVPSPAQPNKIAGGSAPAVSDDQPGAQATPGADVLAAVGLQRAIGLVDGDIVAANLDGDVGRVFDANGLETKVLISGVARRSRCSTALGP